LDKERAKAIGFDEFEKFYGRNRMQAYRLFFEKLLRTLSDDSIVALTSRELTATQAYHRLTEDPETFLVSFPKFKEYHEWILQRQRQKDEDEAELCRMELGLFTVSSSGSDDSPGADIVKLRLTKFITALELYKMDKPLSEHALTGNRSKWGVDVDGLHGEKYYYIPAIRDIWLPKVVNVYLTDGDEGWIISCSCKAKAFDHYKPVFERIINSFQRIYIPRSMGSDDPTESAT
jgi:hypothetical protein